MSTSFRICLGPRWTFFAPAHAGMTMLGTVQRGMQIGALALLADGTYAQINGDLVERLNASRVLHAMRIQNGTAVVVQRTAAPAPVVTIKKRRRITALAT